MKKFLLPDYEIVFPGSNKYVAVKRICREEEKTIVKDGVTYVARLSVPSGDPYIGFVSLRSQKGYGEWTNKDTNETVWIDEDDPVSGGISGEFAEQIRDELTVAIQYLEEDSE